MFQTVRHRRNRFAIWRQDSAHREGLQLAENVVLGVDDSMISVSYKFAARYDRSLHFGLASICVMSGNTGGKLPIQQRDESIGRHARNVHGQVVRHGNVHGDVHVHVSLDDGWRGVA